LYRYGVAATVTATHDVDLNSSYDNPFQHGGGGGHAVVGGVATPQPTPQGTPAGHGRSGSGGAGMPYSAVPLDGGATPNSDFSIRKIGKPPRGPAGDSHSTFSARLASVTASANTSAARLADVVAARRARQVRRYKGGRILLKQLQEESGSKDPSVLAGVLQAPPPDPRYTPPTLMGRVGTFHHVILH
jgi:hypothetical protein